MSPRPANLSFRCHASLIFSAINVLSELVLKNCMDQFRVSLVHEDLVADTRYLYRCVRRPEQLKRSDQLDGTATMLTSENRFEMRKRFQMMLQQSHRSPKPERMGHCCKTRRCSQEQAGNQARECKTWVLHASPDKKIDSMIKEEIIGHDFQVDL
jgi:hypothetical protein